MALLTPPGIASTFENSASASTATLGAVEGPPAGIFAGFASDLFDSRGAVSCDSSELSESSTASVASASTGSTASTGAESACSESSSAFGSQ